MLSRRGPIWNSLLVALFLVVISLPLAANLAGLDGADAGAENRELAAFPRLDGSWQSVAALPAAIGAWFDDHFGFRSTLRPLVRRDAVCSRCACRRPRRS